MKYFSFLFVILFAPVLAVAQSNYREGYVVKTNGDTLKGYINVREWQISPKTIQFKNAVSDKDAQQFTPLTISSFYAGEGFKFSGYMGRVSNSLNGILAVNKSKDTTTRQDTLFLNELVSGPKVALLQLGDVNRSHFFYREHGATPVELLNYSYGDMVDARPVLRDEKVYIQQLEILVNKHPDWDGVKFNTIKWLPYKQGDMVKLFSKWNNIIAPKQGGAHSRLYIGAGLALMQTKFTGEARFKDAVTTASPRITLGFDYFGNPVTQRLFFRAEASFYYNKPRIEGSYVGPGAQTVYQTYQFDQYTAGLSPQIYYTFYSKDNMKLFIGGGMSFNFSSYSNHKVVTKDADKYYESQDNYYKYTFVLIKSWSTFPIQAGLILNKRFEATIGYVPNQTYTDNTNVSVGNSSWHAGLKYFFVR